MYFPLTYQKIRMIFNKKLLPLDKLMFVQLVPYLKTMGFNQLFKFKTKMLITNK